MYVRWGLALSQSFERVHSNEPVLRLPDVSMFGLAASTVLHGGFGLSAIHGDVRPLEEALEIMLQVCPSRVRDRGLGPPHYPVSGQV